MSEFKRGGPVLFAAFLGTMCGASPIPFNVLGALFEPLNKEFGWNKAQVSLGITVFGIIASLLAPAFGRMADRHGVRPVALGSLVAFAAAFAALALTPASLPAFYLLWLLVGVVGIGSTPVTWSRAVNMWFVRQRGLALGLMLISTSVAAVIVPKLAVWSIATYGWREMFVILALLPVLVALPVALMFFREPRPEERPAAIVSAGGQVTGMSFVEAFRTRQFWLLWVSILLIALAYGGAHAHMIPIVGDHGFDRNTAASVVGVVGIGILSGRLIVGFLLDRFWGPAVAFPALCLPAIACVFLMGTSTDLPLIMVAAFMFGFAAGAESDLIAYLASRYFGMASYGRIYGWLYMAFGLGSAVSPLLYGIGRDRTGSYDIILATAGAMFVIGGALLLLLGRYPGEKQREAVE